MISYLITDPSYYGNSLEVFRSRLTEVFIRRKPDMALYRDKKNSEYAVFAKLFIELCGSFNVKSILHNDVLAANQLHPFGIHFSSNQLCSIGLQNKDLYTIFSAHSEIEIENAIKLGLKAVTFSPIFSTPNKGKPKGMDRLKTVTNRYSEKIDIIALGGIINEVEISQVKTTKAKGFASIRYFSLERV